MVEIERLRVALPAPMAKSPQIGALRNDIRRGMRMLVEGNYLLYGYDSRKDEVDLVAVIDGRRELSCLL